MLLLILLQLLLPVFLPPQQAPEKRLIVIRPSAQQVHSFTCLLWSSTERATFDDKLMQHIDSWMLIFVDGLRSSLFYCLFRGRKEVDRVAAEIADGMLELVHEAH